MVLACIYALIRGRWPERVGGVCFTIAWLGSEVIEDFRYVQNRMHPMQMQAAIAALDVAWAGVLLILVFSTRRRWAPIAFGFQCLILALHLCTYLDIRISRFDFFSAYFVASWSELAVFALGSAIEGRRPVWSSV